MIEHFLLHFFMESMELARLGYNHYDHRQKIQNQDRVLSYNA
jgi:hypothetical protein